MKALSGHFLVVVEFRQNAVVTVSGRIKVDW